MTETDKEPAKKAERLAERGVKQVLIYAQEADVDRWDDASKRRHMTRNAWLLQAIERSEQGQTTSDIALADLKKQLEDEKKLRQEWNERGMHAELQVLHLTQENHQLRMDRDNYKQDAEEWKAAVDAYEDQQPPVDVGKMVRDSQAAARGLKKTVERARAKAEKAKRGAK